MAVVATSLNFFLIYDGCNNSGIAWLLKYKEEEKQQQLNNAPLFGEYKIREN